MRITAYAIAAVLLCLAMVATAAVLLTPDDEIFTQEDAGHMIAAANGALAPVYAPLAEQIVEDFDLAKTEGIGIDLGGGPGNLTIELCKRTRSIHWVNADINPHFFPHFLRAAEQAGFGHRVSAIFADAQALPFRDGYADVIVSRGSFQFWDDQQRAFAEIYRVLKRGGVAFIGRGFPRDMPVGKAQSIRGNQNEGGRRGPPQYDVDETAAKLERIMESLGAQVDYTIERPAPENAGVKYGVWLTVRKPMKDTVEEGLR